MGVVSERVALSTNNHRNTVDGRVLDTALKIVAARGLFKALIKINNNMANLSLIPVITEHDM